MSTASQRSISLSEAASIFDICLIVPISVCVYSFIVSPMLIYEFPGKDITTPRLENKIFWPAVAVIALGCLVSRNRSRLTWPPHIIWFAAYLALAGASIVWSFKPEISFSRFSVEMMIIVSVILPAMLAGARADMMRGVFLCVAFGSILNAVWILGGYSTVSFGGVGDEGYPGYFTFKGVLGEFAAFAFLLSMYEMFHHGWRRVFGFIVVIISIYLVIVSGSKGALACAVLAAILTTLVLFVGNKMRVSPAIVLSPLLLCYAILSIMVGGNLVNRISWYIYHNYTLSGRTIIWYFANLEIAKRSLLGWGYRSIWLVGPNSPVLVDAGGWVGKMPSAHNGYYDTMLDTGYIGLVLFIIFILATFHAIGRVARRDLARGWLLLSIALFISLVNFLESGWMRGDDVLWLPFVIVVAEAGRYWQPFRQGLAAAGPVLQRPAIARPRPVLARAGGVDRLLRRRDN